VNRSRQCHIYKLFTQAWKLWTMWTCFNKRPIRCSTRI